MIRSRFSSLFMATSSAGIICSLKAIVIFSLACAGGVYAGTDWDAQSSRYLEKLLQTNPDRLPELDEPPLVEFYLAREYQLLWSNEAGRLDRAYDLLRVIINAKDEGLEPSDYHIDEIRRIWDSSTLGQAVELDLLLSAALYHYSRDVHSGSVDARERDQDWHLRIEPLDRRRLLEDVARKSSIAKLLKELPPPHAGYKALKSHLQHYRERAQQGGWRRLDWGPVLELGSQHAQVLQLKQRLQLSGDLVMDPFPDMDVFDRWLEEAVMRYQSRHGLEVDGRVGPITRRSLNISISDRIRQIRINMMRWRWVPRSLGKRYVLVNMTGFELYIMENGTEVLSMPVIVGNSYRSTPTFSGLISYMEYNPYWTIPKTIVLEDIIPRQLRDPTYLQRKSIKVYRGWENPREVEPQSVDWRNIDPERFPYWMRQDPGPKNALGRIKFLFSNPYAVYLHGTPDKHLFDRVVRTFSSGCIRVKDPVRLAAFLLNDGTQQMEEEVLATVHLGGNQGIDLPVAIPIYLIYSTAWVDDEGKLHFRDDIYGHDAKLTALFGT